MVEGRKRRRSSKREKEVKAAGTENREGYQRRRGRTVMEGKVAGIRETTRTERDGKGKENRKWSQGCRSTRREIKKIRLQG